MTLLIILSNANLILSDPSDGLLNLASITHSLLAINNIHKQWNSKSDRKGDYRAILKASRRVSWK